MCITPAHRSSMRDRRVSGIPKDLGSADKTLVCEAVPLRNYSFRQNEEERRMLMPADQVGNAASPAS